MKTLNLILAHSAVTGCSTSSPTNLSINSFCKPGMQMMWLSPFSVAICHFCRIAADGAGNITVIADGFLHALTSNWISAGARLIPLGQTDSQRLLAQLEPLVMFTAKRAIAASLDDLGSATFRADIASMRHETQYTRLFRS